MLRFKITLLGFILLCSLYAFGDDNEKEIPKLTVRGEATLYKPPDQLSLTVGVVTQEVKAENALDANKNKMRSIIRNLEDLGLISSNYSTGHFTVHPIFSPRPKNASLNWKPSIIGYEVRNTVIIKTEKLNLAGEIIGTATNAGANSIDYIQFGLKDSNIYRDEAIATATANAIAQGQTLANAANLNIHRVLSISLDDAHYLPSTVKTFAYAKGLDTTPIESSEVPIRANVTIVYEID